MIRTILISSSPSGIPIACMGTILLPISPCCRRRVIHFEGDIYTCSLCEKTLPASPLEIFDGIYPSTEVDVASYDPVGGYTILNAHTYSRWVAAWTHYKAEDIKLELVDA